MNDVTRGTGKYDAIIEQSSADRRQFIGKLSLGHRADIGTLFETSRRTIPQGQGKHDGDEGTAHSRAFDSSSERGTKCLVLGEVLRADRCAGSRDLRDRAPIQDP